MEAGFRTGERGQEMGVWNNRDGIQGKIGHSEVLALP